MCMHTCITVCMVRSGVDSRLPLLPHPEDWTPVIKCGDRQPYLLSHCFSTLQPLIRLVLDRPPHLSVSLLSRLYPLEKKTPFSLLQYAQNSWLGIPLGTCSVAVKVIYLLALCFSPQLLPLWCWINNKPHPRKVQILVTVLSWAFGHVLGGCGSTWQIFQWDAAVCLTHRAHIRWLEGCGDFWFLQKEALPSRGQGGVPVPGALRSSGDSLTLYSSGRLTICGCFYLCVLCFVSLKHHYSGGMPMFVGL